MYLALTFSWFDHECARNWPRHRRSVKSVVHETLSDVFRLDSSRVLQQPSLAVEKDHTSIGIRKIQQETHLKASQIYDELVSDSPVHSTEENRVVLLFIQKGKMVRS